MFSSIESKTGYGYRKSNCDLHLYTLESGCNYPKCLDWVQDEEGEKLGRQHLINSQEIRNIHRRLIFESFRKFEIGKLGHRKCEIQRRHLRAKDLDPEFVQTSGESDSEWIVKSGTDEFAVYYVKLDKKSCDCKLHCHVHLFLFGCHFALHSV